jgi:hypothetical protein
VAKPFVPSVPSISTQKDPSTLIPQDVRDPRYCAHRVIGVEMSLSISQWPPLTYEYQLASDTASVRQWGEREAYIVVVTTRSNAIDDEGADGFDAGKRRSGSSRAHDESKN